MDVRSLRQEDRARMGRMLRERWHDETMVVRGEVLRPADLPGFVAEDWAGVVTFRVAGDTCEIVSLDAFDEGRGVGSSLLDAVVEAAREAGCRRIALITTNDNLHALGWYERRGFRVTAIHEGAVDVARRLKPQIPLTNRENGLPIRDEVELERRLDVPLSDR